MTELKWTLHPSLVKLREQINAKCPNRSKASDGAIGDTAHSSRKSDHNPNEHGVVCAIDITHDPKNGFNAAVFAETLRLGQDCRLKYVIFNSRIFSSTVQPWVWRNYKGAPHDHHVHVSVEGDALPWKIE